MKWFFPAAALVAAVAVGALLAPKPASTHHGFQDMTAHDPKVWIVLRDNNAEDGDYVTLSVNGRVYLANYMLRNAGYPVLVDLSPGPNRVEFYGNRDGAGGITLEAALDGVGNVNNTPFPQGATAGFTLYRR